MARSHQIRIISGKWKGRKLSVANRPGLRPTPDRVRETLFAWLMPHLPGARCLDLFAGTGILALESLSRGASHATCLDSQRATCQEIRERASMLLDQGGAQGGPQIEDQLICHQFDSLRWLRTASAQASAPWDIIFADPPFQDDLLSPALTALLECGHVRHGTLVYTEHAKTSTLRLPERLPDNSSFSLQPWRELKAGGSICSLWRTESVS